VTPADPVPAEPPFEAPNDRAFVDDYLNACRAEGRARHAEHAAAAAGACDAPRVSINGSAFADGVEAYFACTLSHDGVARRRLRAPDGPRFARVLAWLRDGMGLAADEVQADVDGRGVAIVGRAAAATVQGALLEHAAVQLALGHVGAPAGATFAMLRPVIAETTTLTVARWLSLGGPAWPAMVDAGFCCARLVWTSVLMPKLVWTQSRDVDSPMVVAQPHDGGYVVDAAPTRVRIAWLGGADSAVELGAAAPAQVTALLQRAAREAASGV
jgi:hypothetical protein